MNYHTNTVDDNLMILLLKERKQKQEFPTSIKLGHCADSGHITNYNN
jgi:hypothetical protein